MPSECSYYSSASTKEVDRKPHSLYDINVLGPKYPIAFHCLLYIYIQNESSCDINSFISVTYCLIFLIHLIFLFNILSTYRRQDVKVCNPYKPYSSESIMHAITVKSVYNNT